MNPPQVYLKQSSFLSPKRQYLWTEIMNVYIGHVKIWALVFFFFFFLKNDESWGLHYFQDCILLMEPFLNKHKCLLFQLKVSPIALFLPLILCGYGKQQDHIFLM